MSGDTNRSSEQVNKHFMGKSIREIPAGWVQNPDGSYSKPKGKEVLLMGGKVSEKVTVPFDATPISLKKLGDLFKEPDGIGKMMARVEASLCGLPIEFVVEHEPTPAPRMTQQDKWLKRPCVVRYFAFRAAVKAAAGVIDKIPDRIECTFHVTMPESWSKKKKAAMAGLPHRQKCDVDNLIKGTVDALFEQDGAIHEMEGKKRWCYPGHGRVVVKLFFFK